MVVGLLLETCLPDSSTAGSTPAKLTIELRLGEVGMYSSFPVEVTVGGSTIFVLNVDRFEKV